MTFFASKVLDSGCTCIVNIVNMYVYVYKINLALADREEIQYIYSPPNVGSPERRYQISLGKQETWSPALPHPKSKTFDDKNLLNIL